jgi:RNA polymerase sigma-54 factor
MSQYLAMLPSQQMRLEQRLTPQLIQSMEILQLPLLALEARVREELEENPVLEELEEQPHKPEPPAREDHPQTDESQAEAESFERLDRMSRELELDPGDLAYGRGGAAPDRDRDAKMDAMANTASRGISLSEHLHQQWALVEGAAEVKRAGEMLIEWLDEDGYLRSEAEDRHQADPENGHENKALMTRRIPESVARLMEEIALSCNPPIAVEVLEEALKLVQTMEPAGAGARDLTECLLIQLRASGEEDPLCFELVRNHLNNLAKNRFPAVAKATRRSVEEIKDALKRISKLNARPGLLVSPDAAPRISPDIIVDYADEGDGYTVRLARGSSPRLRISAQYRQMLQDKLVDKKVRDFVRGRIEAASAIIDAIQYRRERLLELSKVVVDRQRGFFDFGPQHLKVLRMRDLATEFECDPSTISRTVDGKYLQSPRGIYPLRMFFTGGTSDTAGESVSWDSLKAKVKEIIDNEDKSDPLSDDEIVKRLSATTSVPIARRTVAKYRAILGIPSARQRRVF